MLTCVTKWKAPKKSLEKYVLMHNCAISGHGAREDPLCRTRW